MCISSVKVFVFFVILTAFCLATGADARGGGRGGGGRGRGSRTSASGYIQRGNPKWKPNPSQDSRAFEWAKVTRFIGKIFGAGVIKSSNAPNPIPYKGYQGSYKPQNVYHPKKPRPVAPKVDKAPAARQQQQAGPVHSERAMPAAVTNTFYGRQLNHKPLLYAAIFHKFGVLHRDTQQRHYYDYSHVDHHNDTMTRDTSIVILKAQSLSDWIEDEATSAEPSEPLNLEDGLHTLPFYGHHFENWIPS